MNELKKHIKESESVSIIFLRWFLLASISGIAVGIVISFFLKSLQWATSTRESNPWLLYMLPIGGAFVSYLYSKYGKDSSKGNNLIIERINEGEGRIPFRMAPLVFLGTFITHLFGGSAGREGTGVQIGASVSSKIGELLKLKGMDYTLLIISGVSSGFGVVFGTPIAGTVFGLEVSTLGKMRYEAIIPCFISSYIGNFIAEIFKVQHSHYNMGVSLTSVDVFFKVILCAVLFGLTSKLFAELTHALKKFFAAKIPNTSLKSFIGGIIIIIIVLILGTRIYLGLSLDLLSNAFNQPVPKGAFIIKLVLTSLTLAVGFQGGEVTPLFVIGATLGNLLASIIGLPIEFLAGLGMIGVFAGATKTPIASFIMGIELFGSANIGFIFIACVISYVFAGKSGIYTSQDSSLLDR
ncbi:voltage-gated chloride channel family protein [Paraclostridium bifermentans]|uniref:voltage-gated chloride channel family protein n=1 Tax=Paraclostridium bifermentans TaxID=1490 RepID=UPI001C11A2A4|nr:voltage-gated chloride channel family protein [Paraclostridium bifermentans]MBU5289912.1 voltage-gated chloride channel family protein [Paraclostridium bifermentans]